MKIVLESVEPGTDSQVLANEILEDMPQMGVASLPARDILHAYLSIAVNNANTQGRAMKDVLIVAGKRPVPPRDGKIEWAGDFFVTGFDVDPLTGRVDYRRRQARTGVTADQLLGRLTLPRDGEPGMDVLGNRLPVGRPRRVRLRMGPGVRMEEAEGVQSYYATQAGRVRFTFDMLAVDNVFRVNGNVGLSSGNIVHPGAVVVDGDVQAGSSITAEGDIEIMGTVEPSDITTGSNLIIQGGLTGAPGRRVKVAGDLQVKFIQDANLEVSGDATVANEMLNTTLVVGGMLKMPGGRVVGGRVTAQGGMILRRAGSEAHARTALCVVQDDPEAAARAEKRARIPLLEKILAKLHQVADPMVARETRLSAAQREELTPLLVQISDKEHALQTLRSELEGMEAALAESLPVMLIQERIFAETTFHVREEKRTITEDLIGPLRVTLQGNRIELRAPSKNT